MKSAATLSPHCLIMKLNRFARNWSLCWDRFPATLPSPAPAPLCTYCPKWPAPCPVVNALVDFWQMARPMAGATYFLARALCCCCPPLPPLWLWFSVPPMQWATFCTTCTNIRNVLRFVAPTVKQSLNVPCPQYKRRMRNVRSKWNRICAKANKLTFHFDFSLFIFTIAQANWIN